jgi:hypothetical protein
VNGVGFSLVELGTLDATGFAPTLASAPNSTYAREFAPTDGPQFLNVINANTEGDLLITFPHTVTSVAAEIRSGSALNDVDDLAFELYRHGALVGLASMPIRGQDDFFFYGLTSTVAFDAWVIRQRPDYRFALENLRFVPEPTAIVLTLAGLSMSLVRHRRRR